MSIDIITVSWCESNVHWTKEVPGSNPGTAYRVTYNMNFGWECTCPAFKFAKGDHKTCKHIEAVEHERCAHGESALWGAPLYDWVEKDGSLVCPDCGGPITGLRIAV